MLDSWYRLFEVTTSNDENSYYELKYFNNLSEHVNITRLEANKQLNKLVDLLQKTFKNNFNLVAFKQKYLKSIQEIEIELAIEHLDSNSIIWFQRTTSNSTQNNNVEENCIFKALQLKVFSYNYKNFKTDLLTTQNNNNNNNGYINDSYFNLLNQFIEEACKKSVDYHVQQFKSYETFLSEFFVFYNYKGH